ncbi:hypothetical protein Csa_023669, partial [Cucumis sativus]
KAIPDRLVKEFLLLPLSLQIIGYILHFLFYTQKVSEEFSERK